MRLSKKLVITTVVSGLLTIGINADARPAKKAPAKQKTKFVSPLQGVLTNGTNFIIKKVLIQLNKTLTGRNRKRLCCFCLYAD